MTKQALLHHFGSKERLYREVLSQMAEPLTGLVERARPGADPQRRMEDIFAGLLASLFEHPENAQLLMRELLDNPARAGTAHSWPMRSFLDSLTAAARKAQGPSLGEAEALTRIYLMLGAMKYFAVSEPTLRRMYGETAFAAMKTHAEAEVRRMARTAFG